MCPPVLYGTSDFSVSGIVEKGEGRELENQYNRWFKIYNPVQEQSLDPCNYGHITLVFMHTVHVFIDIL